MEHTDSLEVIGLNKKQRAVYLLLLEEGAQTASDIASSMGEQRTNAYLLVEHLVALGLVEKDESQPVVRFRVTNPAIISSLASQKQRDINNQLIALKRQLPDLVGLYQLHTASEGMAYFEGIKGYTAALDDMTKSTLDVKVFGASTLGAHRPDARRILDTKLQKRALNKVKTQILLANDLREIIDLPGTNPTSIAKMVEIRFWDAVSFGAGEIVLYGSSIVLTSYDEKLVSIIIKNPALSDIFRAVFDTAWRSACTRHL